MMAGGADPVQVGRPKDALGIGGSPRSTAALRSAAGDLQLLAEGGNSGALLYAAAAPSGAEAVTIHVDAWARRPSGPSNSARPSASAACTSP